MVNGDHGTSRAGRSRTFVVGSDIKKGSQRVVDYVVLVAARRHDIVEFCVALLVERLLGGVTDALRPVLSCTCHPRTVAHSQDHTTPQMPCRIRASLTRIILPSDVGYEGLYREAQTGC